MEKKKVSWCEVSGFEQQLDRYSSNGFSRKMIQRRIMVVDIIIIGIEVRDKMMHIYLSTKMMIMVSIKITNSYLLLLVL